MKAKRLATLTEMENAAWVKYFLFYLDDGHAEPAADELAWEAIKLDFPRLEKYEGCEP